MSTPPDPPEFPSPSLPADTPKAVRLRYLDYFRAVLVRKLDGLTDEQVRSSLLPSGWSPLDLIRHLTFVERRWLEWGFEARDIGDPFADSRDGRWYVAPEETPESVLAQFAEQAERTRAVVERHDLDEIGLPGQRWDGDPPASLDRVLLHLVQEYARHAGHLDIVRELLDGRVGEE